ncbi:DUF2652 domain-containing protein [Chitinophaga filiformis]|uniref:DUF2652 domain-containing protein n=1 Tax=Chitinophaga filiformis TaxID=104663 RepID=A0A1G7S950_CHIFI|nr:DUF2652 domain-containing protein [Chitinophaga filiformis]SDG19587.1 Protein of unknown function [Chitinophaga filiformis]
MATTNATILIPDISGFTEFMTTTELNHSTLAINMLIDAMIKAIGDEYEVVEIEGDAVLLVRKGSAPSREEILNTCMNIFNAFHYQRKWMQQHMVCPCGACQAITNLTLKFVVHHGPVAEITVGRFVKQSGPEMIIAHRLLKNSIDSNEYLLITEKLFDDVTDAPVRDELEWVSSSEDYPSIGTVNYRFALLNKARERVPELPALKNDYCVDGTCYVEKPIPANYRDVYMVVMNIPGRAEWVPGLRKVEQDIPAVFIGSIHYCTFDNYQAIISPLRMTISDEQVFYAESCSIPDMGLSLVYEFVFNKLNEHSCFFACRFLNNGQSPVPEEMHTDLLQSMQDLAEKLAIYCAQMESASLKPAFQKD